MLEAGQQQACKIVHMQLIMLCGDLYCTHLVIFWSTLAICSKVLKYVIRQFPAQAQNKIHISIPTYTYTDQIYHLFSALKKKQLLSAKKKKNTKPPLCIRSIIYFRKAQQSSLKIAKWPELYGCLYSRLQQSVLHIFP